MARRYKTSKQKRAYQKRYRRLRAQYEDYKAQFEARKADFEKRGLEFYDPNLLSFNDYKSVRPEKITDMKQDIKEGKRKTVGNVNREIISDQAYELSFRQANVLGEYLLENEQELLEEMDLVYKYTDEAGNERVNLKKKIDLMMKIRQGEFIEKDVGLWDMISDFRSQYYELDKSEQDKIIQKWSKAKGRKMKFGEALKYEVGQTFFNSPD